MDERAFLYCSNCEGSYNWRAFSIVTQASARLYHAVYAAPGLPRPPSFYEIMATTAMREGWQCFDCSDVFRSAREGWQCSDCNDVLRSASSFDDLNDGTCAEILSYLLPLMPKSINSFHDFAAIACASRSIASAGDRVALQARHYLHSEFQRSLERYPSLRDDMYWYGPPSDFTIPTWSVWSVERWLYIRAGFGMPLERFLRDRCYCKNLQEVELVYKTQMHHTAGWYESEELLLKKWTWSYTDGWAREYCI